jgi:hypothetical protein
MIGIVDRIEGNYAVVELEDKKITNIKLDILPQDIKEGDVINIQDCITIDLEETHRRKDKMLKELMLPF